MRSYVFTIQENLTFIWTNQAHDHIEGRGLSCTVGTQKSYDFAAVNGQAYIVHHAAAAVDLHQVGGNQVIRLCRFLFLTFPLP